MSTTRLIVAIVVLAALGGAIYISNQNEAAKEGRRDPDAPPRILEIPEADVAEIRFERPGEPATVVKREDGAWVITAPERLEAPPATIATVTSAASTLDSERIVAETQTGLDAYGLEPPLATVTFTMQDGSVHTLSIGEDTTDGTGTYATVSGDPRLYTVPAFRKATFDMGLMDLRERHLLRFDTDQVTQLQFQSAGNAPFRLTSADSRWRIESPRSARADGGLITSLLAALRDIEIDPEAAQPDRDLSGTDQSEGNQNDALQQFANAAQFATATLETPDGELTLEVHQTGGQFFARSNQIEGVFPVTVSAPQALDVSYEDLLNKRLFDFGFETPVRIRHTLNGDERVIEKYEDIWLENGRTLDSVTVQNFIAELRELEASRFEDGGFGEATMEISVTMSSTPNTLDEGDGAEPATETVLLQETENIFLASRPGEPGVYWVEQGDVAGLRQAAAAVREAVDPE